MNELTIEQLRKWHDGEEPSPPEMQEAYAFVDEMVKHAGTDAGGGYVWHGWVLRWAYLAGVVAERERCAQIADSYAADDWIGAEGARRVAAAIRSPSKEGD